MKKLISLVLAGSLITANLSVPVASYGAETQKEDTAVISAETVNLTTAAISLSLDDAVKRMQTTGSEAETAEINKESDTAIAKGYAETYRSIDETLSDLQTLATLADTPAYAAAVSASLKAAGYSSVIDVISVAEDAGATGLNQTIIKMRRDFAKGQIESNYQAEMNGIEYETVEVYYNVLLAAENARIAEENAQAKRDILKDTESMRAIGMVANKEVLAAKAELATAESAAQAAATTLETAKMSFNFLLGYPILQEVTLTDSLSEIEAPTVTLDDAITQALTNRNEIRGANFAVTVYEQLIKSMALRCSSTSSTYLNEEVAYRNAKKTAEDAVVKIEIDIRSQYNGLEDKKVALEKARKTLEYAEEGYRLTKLSYSVGMSTLAELQSMQVTRYTAALGEAAALRDYDLAVYTFKYACAIGTSRLPL